MTAGSPRARHVDTAALTDAHTQRIARLFAEGMPAGRIALIARCTRARVAQVADSHGWRLDAAGVLPREQRPAVTPGRPIPPVGSGLAAERRPVAPLPPLPRIPAQRGKTVLVCKRDGCTRPAKSAGLGVCAACYMAARRAKAAS